MVVVAAVDRSGRCSTRCPRKPHSIAAAFDEAATVSTRSRSEFIDAAAEHDAEAILASSLYGHAEQDCQGFQQQINEAGLDVTTTSAATSPSSRTPRGDAGDVQSARLRPGLRGGDRPGGSHEALKPTSATAPVRRPRPSRSSSAPTSAPRESSRAPRVGSWRTCRLRRQPAGNQSRDGIQCRI